MVRGVISAGTGMGVGAAWRCCHGVLKYLSRDKKLHRRQVRILRDLRHCPTGGPTSPQLQGVKKDVFDLTRTLDDDFWPWASMEGFKDGMLSSPKYDSKMNVFNLQGHRLQQPKDRPHRALCGPLRLLGNPAPDPRHLMVRPIMDRAAGIQDPIILGQRRRPEKVPPGGEILGCYFSFIG